MDSALKMAGAQRNVCDDVILVVDDETSVLVTVCRILAYGGFRVLSADSPEEALRIGAERGDPIHLMLCDVVMPGLGGPRMAERFSTLHPETRFLFMAGLPDGPDVDAILARGAAFLPKPFRPKELVERVRGVLAGGTAKS